MVTDSTRLLTVDEALARLLACFSPVDTVGLPLGQASGSVLAEAIVAGDDLPPFDYSSMDGFAVRVGDVLSASQPHPCTLPVQMDIPAGSHPQAELLPGHCARITTGAPLPPRAEAVIPVEQTDQPDRQAGAALPGQVTFFSPARAGDNIRPRGQDVRAGDEIFAAGFLLRPQDLGFLAMLGVAQVGVYRPPRVAILSTGDELLPAGAPRTPGKIYDANSFTLGALAAQMGAQTVALGIIPDDAAAVKDALDRAAASSADLILSSAGVSMGAFDYVRSVIEEHGKLDFWRVNMRPGKPLAFGWFRQTPVIGLPGNPVSAFVGFEVFARPVIARLSGRRQLARPAVSVTLEEPVESDGRESYLRAIVTRRGGELFARLTGHQGSGNLRSLVQANALLIVPSEVKSLPIGFQTTAWLLGEILEPDPDHF